MSNLPPNLVLSNVNVFKDDILICDSYISEIASEHLAQLSKGKNVYHFAPELTHIDKLGFKLCTILRIGRVKSITVFTKDGSPHALQIPLVVQEAVENTGFDKSKVSYYVWEKGNLIQIKNESVRKSRHLSEIETLIPYWKFKNLVEILRKKCPNDKKETFKSITEHFIEEANELEKEVNANSKMNYKEELGDILFNIFLFSKVAEEKKLFNAEELFNFVVEKMVKRHDKIFNPRQRK